MRGTSSDQVFAQQALQLVRVATMAPSRYNTQPWVFSIERNLIRIHADERRSLPISDPFKRHLYVALGCAVENLMLAARSYGLAPAMETFAEDHPEGSVAVRFSRGQARHGSRGLLRAIPHRQTTRCLYSDVAVAAEKLRALVTASRQQFVQFGLFSSRAHIETIGAFAQNSASREARRSDHLDELLTWLRLERSHHEVGDGLLPPTLGLPLLPRWLGRRIYAHLIAARAKSRTTERQITSSPALMLFLAEKDHPEAWFNVGRSYQRVVLTATAMKIRSAPLPLPSAELRSFLSLTSEQPVLLARLGYADRMPDSVRRHPKEVVIQTIRPKGAAGSRRKKEKRRAIPYEKMTGVSRAMYLHG